MATQWNYAPNGKAIGLRYESLPFALRQCGVSAADRDDVMNMVRELECDLLNRVHHG